MASSTHETTSSAEASPDEKKAKLAKLAKQIEDNYLARLKAFAEGAKLIIEYLPDDEVTKLVPDQPPSGQYEPVKSTDVTKRNELKSKVDEVFNQYSQQFAEIKTNILINDGDFNQKLIDAAKEGRLKRSLEAYIKELEQLSSDKKFALGESIWAWQDYPTSKELKERSPKEYEGESIEITPNLQQSESDEVTKPASVSSFTMQQKETYLALPLTEKQVENIQLVNTNPPGWFEKLPKWAQNAFKVKIFNDGKLNQKAYDKYKPATLRGVPGIVNTTEHQLTVTVNGKKITTKTYRQGVPVPYDMPESEQIEHTRMNLEQVLQFQKEQGNIESFNQFYKPQDSTGRADYGSPITHISLLSGTWEDSKFFMYPWDKLLNPTKDNNTKFIEQTKEAIETLGGDDKSLITSYNVPVNAMRPFQPKPINELFIQQMQNRFSKLRTSKSLPEGIEREHVNALAKVIESMRHYNANLKNIPERNANLFSAGLMMAAVRLSGGTVVSNCKSGKDREGAAILEADAIIAYTCTHDAAPNFDHKDLAREDFLAIKEKLYLDGAHQAVAFRTSPGSGGIKDEGFFDQDFINRPNVKQFHKVSKSIADNNKPESSFLKNIWKDKKLLGGLILGVVGLSVGLALTGFGWPALAAIAAALAIILFVIAKASPRPEALNIPAKEVEQNHGAQLKS